MLDPSDLVALLKVHKRTILRWRMNGKLPKSMDALGSQQVRWHPDEIEAWLAAGMPSQVVWQAIWTSLPFTARNGLRQPSTTDDNREQPGATEYN